MRWSRLAGLGILIGGGSAAAIVLVSSKPALALPFTFRATDSCCNYTYSGTCDARPGNPDPRCKSGHLGIGFNADFLCNDGCISNVGDCYPDILTGAIPDIPNGQDDDCDGQIDVQSTAPVGDLTILETDTCCHFRYRDLCIARPDHPDPACKYGRKAAGDNADFGCGCAGDPNACIPNIATAEIPELPNGRDDDCDGFIDDEKCDGIDNDGDGQIDEDEGSCLLRLLIVPYCWSGTQTQFQQAADLALNTFYDATGMLACQQNIGKLVVDVAQVNVPCPDATHPYCDDLNVLASDTRNAVAAAGIGSGVDFGDTIALTNNDICGHTEGRNNLGGFMWSQTGGIVMTHEIGHSFDLGEEYCSPAAGSNPAECFQTSVNFLGADLGCDPHDDDCCDDCGDNLVCCKGNFNPKGGRCIMSYSNADDPRAFCTRCFAQITNPPDPRTNANPNGMIALNCTNAHIGQQTILALEYRVMSDGRPIIQFSRVAPGRGSMTGEMTQGNYATEVRDANGALLFRMAYPLAFVPTELSSGVPANRPPADHADVALKAAVPPTMQPTDKFHVQIFKNGSPVGQTTVNGAPPVVSVASQTLECVANSAFTILQATASDADGDSLGYSWSSPGPGVTIAAPKLASTPATFPLGTRSVQVQVTDGVFTRTAAASVTVSDTQGPVVTPPPDITITSCTAPNIGTATAFDACSQTSFPTTSNKPSRFPLGVTVVTWRAVDSLGNVGTATQRVTANLGDDTSCCPPGTNIIRGTSNNDTLNGTSGSDCILGFGAQDVINGNGGNDFISGGDGDDIIDGGSGNDRIYGGSGQDQLRGGIGADFLDGGDGDDRCWGGDDNDVLHGGQGQDQLFGENGDDQLFGDDGTDHLEGGAGNDLLDGGPGPGDVCIGGSGTDTLVVPACESATQ